jgi:hypothetical protein
MMSAAPKRARETASEPIEAEDHPSNERLRTAVWAVVCASVIFLCLSSRAAQKREFAPWGDFIINLFQH